MHFIQNGKRTLSDMPAVFRSNRATQESLVMQHKRDASRKVYLYGPINLVAPKREWYERHGFVVISVKFI